MRLITAHRILIAAAIAFFLFYAGFHLRRYVASGDGLVLAQVVGAVVIAALLVLYYRSLAKRWSGRS